MSVFPRVSYVTVHPVSEEVRSKNSKRNHIYFNERPNFNVRLYKKEVLPVVMERIRTKYPKYYKEIVDKEWVYSKYCGCSCGCSPGFHSKSGGGFQIFVGFEGGN